MSNLENVKSKLTSREYDFLRENKELGNIAYLVLSGSIGYGTNNEYSDIDLRGVLIENKKYLFGFEPFEQFEELKTDTVIYSLKKFVKMCSEANPNVIELLGVEDDCIVLIDDVGKKLRENNEIFLSKKVIKTYGNYANAQLRRLQNALCHDSFDEKDKLKHIKNSLDSQIEHFQRNYKQFGDNAINILVNDDNLELCFDIELKKYPIKDFVAIYSELNNTVKTYNKLNHRNNKKDEAHINKHAMHLVRLLITGTDILNGKGIITKRRDEHKLLMDIRNGVYTYDEVFEITDECSVKFEEAAKNTKLRDTVDLEKIENFVIDAYNKKMKNIEF